MSNEGETRNVVDGDYYSNILMVYNDSPLTTIAEKRAKWYIERSLGVFITEEERAEKYSSYSAVLRLNFKPKFEDATDPFYQQIIETRCVVCGERNGLSLHHVVPSVIRKHLPDEHKNHSHGWCVLLCEKHHSEADKLAQELHDHEIRQLDQKILAKQKEMRQQWAEDFIVRSGGIEAMKGLYREKFKQLAPQFLPEGFLQDHKPRPQILP